MVFVRYIEFRFTGDRPWLRMSRINDDHVIACVWIHPINKGLLFGQLVGVPFKAVCDTWYAFS